MQATETAPARKRQPHPKEATCHRCRDLRHRRVQVAWIYKLAALCPHCSDFVFEAIRGRERRGNAELIVEAWQSAARGAR
jgi:hypothetical protein